eukprot:TRINITY_DN11695_c2_g1_i2.p2 TRINITY_DN11695_c2_g1~~TRINITY_DN11695_c2_g1_i2.p2  ORF type:complete len:141 (+),score=18.91 TRINITY_DN11695_c2_g1_i2:81-503(+)
MSVVTIGGGPTPPVSRPSCEKFGGHHPLLATIVTRSAELPLFANWRCHLRRLGLPFVVAAGTPGLQRALEQITSGSRGEEVVWYPGAGHSRLRLLQHIVSSLPEQTGLVYTAVDTTILLRPVLLAVAGSQMCVFTEEKET